MLTKNIKTAWKNAAVDYVASEFARYKSFGLKPDDFLSFIEQHLDDKFTNPRDMASWEFNGDEVGAIIEGTLDELIEGEQKFNTRVALAEGLKISYGLQFFVR